MFDKPVVGVVGVVGVVCPICVEERAAAAGSKATDIVTIAIVRESGSRRDQVRSLREDTYTEIRESENPRTRR